METDKRQPLLPDLPATPRGERTPSEQAPNKKGMAAKPKKKKTWPHVVTLRHHMTAEVYAQLREIKRRKLLDKT